LNHLKGIDTLIDGHIHLIYEEITKDLFNKNIPFVQTVTKLGIIGVFTIYI
jgi:hypothetical protein